MPSLSDLKNRAAKAKDFTSSTLSNTRDRYTSQSSKNINWNAEIKRPPPPPSKPSVLTALPPPPSRTHNRNDSREVSDEGGESPRQPLRPPVAPRPVAATSATASALRPPPPPSRPSHGRNDSRASLQSVQEGMAPSPPPPPRPGAVPGVTPQPLVRGETQPDRASPASTPFRPGPSQAAARSYGSQGTGEGKIDWANMSSEDKEVFFSWLDEFFGRYFGKTIIPQKAEASERTVDMSPRPPVSTPKPTVAVAQGPPPIPTWSRPPVPPPAASSQSPSQDDAPLTSYPPATEYGSAAADLAQYFSPFTHWDTPWYASSNPMPPPIVGNTHTASTFSWETRGGTKTISAGVLFSDLSMCWFSVQSPSSPADPNDSVRVKRDIRFLLRPGALDGDTLLAAHETYGEAVAVCAEEYVRTRTVCERGECWDLANVALRQFEQWPQIPKPVPSIARTHGHLIFEGRATGRSQIGRWRGGDVMVRRGDIVEWRSVRLSMGGGAFAILGNPDHTAVIVADCVPRVGVADGQPVRPAEIGTLEVVEQSAGKLPERASYNLSGLEEGEVWIYRPVSMLEYVGALLEPKCPDGVNAFTL